MKSLWEDYVAVVWRLLPGALLVLAVLWLYGCTTRQAQVATQTALNETSVGVETAHKALIEETPRLSKEAGARVWHACPAPCAAFDPRYEAEFEPVTKAFTGIKIARDSLHIAQGTQDIWVATGELPNTDPLCDGISKTVGPIPRLLTDAGVKNIPSEVEAFAGPGSKIVCDIVSGWIKRR
ncbi:MAG: hypothetical protein WC683_20730 [bacterium]